MKRFSLAWLALAVSLVLAPLASAQTKWDMHLNYPPSNFHTKGAQTFADRVAKESGGALEIKLHPGSALGFKGQELLRVMAEGQLAIAEIPTGMVEGDAPVMALTAQPFIASNVKEQRLLYDLARPVYEKELNKFDSLVLYSSCWPFSGIYTPRPIKSVADLKGLKMRVYDGTGEAFGRLTGIAARNIPFSEVYPAMKSGLLDSLYTSSVSGVDSKAWEMTKYFTRINIVGPVNLYVVNKKAFAKLPKDLQDKIIKLAKQSEDEMWKLVEEMDQQSVDTLRKNGMDVLEVDKAFRKELDQVGVKLREDWAKKAGPEVQKVLDEFYKQAGRN